MTAIRRSDALIGIGLVIVLGLVPVYSHVTDQPYYLTLFGRILVFALAALGLNIALGLGGMVSFGHSVYFGIGAYCVSVSAQYGLINGWYQLAITTGVCAFVALAIGSISLRTTGVAFIMITMAFGQMFYFLAISLRDFGGDDGLPLLRASIFPPVLDLESRNELYYVALLAVIAMLAFTSRLTQAPFGLTLGGCRMNEPRMRTLGVPTFRYKLTAYVISALVCGLAGLLFANLTNFASPAYLSWQISGDLMVFIILGGVGHVLGPLVGATAFLLLEEGLRAWTDHWMAIQGTLIALIALVYQQGLIGRRPRMGPS